MEKGYAVIPGVWKKGDALSILEVKALESHPEVTENTGKIAIQRGPLVYCAEAIDKDGHALDIGISVSETFTATYMRDLMTGVTVLDGEGMIANTKKPVRLVPCFAWSHRSIAPMAVWLDAL